MTDTSYDDPYRNCERVCTHDLARGVTLAELLGGDGPFDPLGGRQPRLGAGSILTNLREGNQDDNQSNLGDHPRAG